MKIRKSYTCPLELTHDLTKGKWKPIILWQLKPGHVTPASLEKNIQGINQKMLMEQLKELLDWGIVTKKTYEGYPLSVEYSLTQRGEKMLEALTIMQNIGIELMQESERS
jgi:DNA-binding HxlR family transcriptional regulator